jgi:hypothetical protein
MAGWAVHIPILYPIPHPVARKDGAAANGVAGAGKLVVDTRFSALVPPPMLQKSAGLLHWGKDQLVPIKYQ